MAKPVTRFPCRAWKAADGPVSTRPSMRLSSGDGRRCLWSQGRSRSRFTFSGSLFFVFYASSTWLSWVVPSQALARPDPARLPGSAGTGRVQGGEAGSLNGPLWLRALGPALASLGREGNGRGREKVLGGGLQVTGHLVSLGLQPASPPRGLSLLLPLGPSLGAESNRFLSSVTGQSSRLPGCLVCLVCVVGGGAGLPLCRFGDAGCSWTPSSPSSASGPWSLGLCGLLPAWRGPRNGRRSGGVGGAR